MSPRLDLIWLSLLAWLVASPLHAQTLGQGGDTDIPWLRLSAALLLCLGLAVGGAFALHRRLGGRPLGPMNLPGSDFLKKLGSSAGERRARLTDIETRRLSTQVTVSVFKCDGRDFLVAASVQGQIVLVSLDEEAGSDQ